MSVIEAAAVRCQTMADGTLRLVVDIEPRHAQDAFRLFGSPGVAVALAALRAEPTPTPAPAPQASEAEARPKGGALARLAGQWCQRPDFIAWIGAEDAEHAAQLVRESCGIESRAQLDSNADAAEAFHRLIRGPFSHHLTTGETA